MDFTVLEARRFTSDHGVRIGRVVKDYEIDLECSSERIYFYDGIKERCLHSGDVLVRCPHGIVSSIGAQDSYILTLDFSQRPKTEAYSRNIQGELQPFTGNELITRLEPIIHPTHTREIMAIYQKLTCLPNHNIPAAKELVTELIYTLNAEISRKNYDILIPEKNISTIVIEYIQENMERHISLDDLSKLVSLEKSYFLRLFRKETGKTPIETLIEMRLNKASDLIISTGLTIAEIADRCGYNTVSFFISEYKKRYGITPDAQRSRQTYN